MKTERVKVNGFLVADYLLRQAVDATQVVVLLHGYGESAATVFQKLEPVLPPTATVLAPNGPFPIPQKIEKGYKMGFSWYFYDPQTDEYFIDMELGVTYLKNLLTELKLAQLPVSFVGFSQGGYLAPFAALAFDKPLRVVGIACEFLADELSATGKKISFSMDSIHGADDQVVDAAKAAASHAKLKDRQVKGECHLVSGVGHRISSGMRSIVENIFAAH